MSQNLSSAAVVIGALRVKVINLKQLTLPFHIQTCVIMNYIVMAMTCVSESKDISEECNERKRSFGIVRICVHVTSIHSYNST